MFLLITSSVYSQEKNIKNNKIRSNPYFIIADFQGYSFAGFVIGYNNDRSASIDLPFFDGGWWSIQASFDYDGGNDAYIYGANRIGEEVGFSATHSVTVVDPQYWTDTEISYFPSSHFSKGFGVTLSQFP